MGTIMKNKALGKGKLLTKGDRCQGFQVGVNPILQHLWCRKASSKGGGVFVLFFFYSLQILPLP